MGKSGIRGTQSTRDSNNKYRKPSDMLERLAYSRVSAKQFKMTTDLPETDFQRFWRRLQQLGLNAYEARSYLVLIGHQRFKALELAARAHVPRQKIYEVLDSLVEKGFAQVVQEKTKLFSAVPPDEAIPSYLARRAQALEQQLAEQNQAAAGMVKELMSAYSEGQGGRGTLDYLRIVNDPGQVASQFRKMLTEARHE